MRPIRAITALYLLSIAYSVVRYVVFAPKNAEHIPVFIVNKGLSMAAALCFTTAFFLQLRQLRRSTSPPPEPANPPATHWFRAGVFGVIAHIPLSLTILQPSYFKEFFLDPSAASAAGPRLSWSGEMVFLFGALGAAGVYLLTRATWSALARWQLSLATMLVLLAHVCWMGYNRGLNINASHAYLPPMWLLSALGLAAGVAFLLLSKPATNTR
jgi:hypothetical protein